MKVQDYKHHLSLGLLALVAILIFVVILVDVFNFGVDDSYIFFRYADNLVSGHGFVFNPGEAAGEGFTSLIWLLMLAFAGFIGSNIIIFSKIIGITFHLLSTVLFFFLVIKLIGKKSYAKATAFILSIGLLINYQLIAHSVSGMETPLYILSIVTLLLITTSALQAPPENLKWWLGLSVATTMIYLVRPEGIVAGGISLLTLAISRPKSLLKYKPWVYGVVGLLIPLGFYFTWKMIVFGTLMPLSYYHKFIVRSEEYSDSFHHLIRFIKAYGWITALAVLSIILFFRKEKDKISTYTYYSFLFLVMVGIYLFFYPAMNYLHRFYISYLPLLMLMILPLIHFLVKKLFQLSNFNWHLLILLGLTALLCTAMNVDLGWSKKRMKNWSNMVNPKIYRAKLGKLMAQLPRDVRVANSEMGVIPYYSDLSCIDMAGLTDPHIAHHGLTMNYLIERKVDLILFHRNVKKVTMAQWDKYTLNYKDVFLSKEFNNNFEFICSYAAWPGGQKKYYFYANKTSANFLDIQRWSQKYRSHFGDFK